MYKKTGFPLSGELCFCFLHHWWRVYRKQVLLEAGRKRRKKTTGYLIASVAAGRAGQHQGQVTDVDLEQGRRQTP